MKFKEEYKDYLIEVSKVTKSDIYSHDEIARMLKDLNWMKLFGYNSADMDKVIEKARIMADITIIWDKVDVYTYDEFIARKRDCKLNEIGI